MTKHIDRLTRYEADIVVRQLTGLYHYNYGFGASSFHTEERFAEFCKNLAEILGCEDTEQFRSHLEGILFIINELDFDYWTQRRDNTHRDYWEKELNAAVHHALILANTPGEEAKYYTQPVAA